MQRLALPAFLLGLLACSKSPSTAADGAAAAGDATDDRGSDSDSGPAPTSELCTQLAEARCASDTATCCTRLSRPYSERGCRAQVVEECERRLLLVAAGKARLDESRARACADAWRSAFAACEISEARMIGVLATCAKVIDGLTPIGGACRIIDRGYDCAAPPGGVPVCRAAGAGEGACALQRAVISEGADCGDGNKLCDDGLYCGGTSFAYTCRRLAGAGAPCTEDFACHEGLRCAAGQCGPGLPDGSPCTQERKCASSRCSANIENPNGRCLARLVASPLAVYCN